MLPSGWKSTSGRQKSQWQRQEASGADYNL